jgi:ribose transport system ATP-binding protein
LTTNPFLNVSAVSKQFPGVKALDGVDFHVASGEIVGLVGENGAGKSTLLKILGGIHRPDSGTIALEGVPVSMHSPADAARLGIGIIHQEREVIETLDVAGNVFLGREPRWAGPLRLLDRRRMEADTERQLARIGGGISPRVIVRRLSPAQQQFVAIVRALSMNARLLVLDEPTASLGSSEAERLFAVLQDLRAGGTAIVYVSHRLKEIEALADRAVVLRDGRNAGMLHRGEVTRDRLVRLMVGRAIDRVPREAMAPGTHQPRLHLERIRTRRYPRAEVSLTVNGGEVLGIAGLIGAGRSELAETICGVVPAVSGRVMLDGQPVVLDSPRDAIREGMCLIPEDRRGRGIIAEMTVRENVTLPALRSYARFGLVQRSAETSAARDAAAALTVKASSIESAVATLSGGNQQKVVLGKWLALAPRVMIFDEPTQGVDVGAKVEIHRLMRRLAEDGAAVVMISSDIEEIVAESDRVAVMHEGLITGILDRSSATPEAIMQLAIA